MNIAELQIGADKPLKYFVFNKAEIAAMLAVADKNPRSQFLYMCPASGTSWVVGSNRAVRVSCSNDTPTEWLRVGIKPIKELKLVLSDALLIRNRGIDVVQLHKVSYEKKGWAIDDGADMTIDKQREGAVQAIQSKIVSVPRIGSADYQLPVIESFFYSNTGGRVPCMDLGLDFMAVIPKIASAVGKNQLCRMSPGHGEVPVVFHTKPKDGNTEWRYALLEQSPPVVPEPIPRPPELDEEVK